MLETKNTPQGMGVRTVGTLDMTAFGAHITR
jgi:hypothetical protein